MDKATVMMRSRGFAEANIVHADSCCKLRRKVRWVQRAITRRQMMIFFGDGGEGEPIGIERQREQVRMSGRVS